MLIVGGGPAGLILGRHLGEHRIPYRILERGKIGQAWRGMRTGMVLLSPSVPGTDWTSLSLDSPLWALPGARKPFPTREDFLCYIEAYARGFGVRLTENVTVARAAAANGGFRVETSAGDRECRFLVLATGAYATPHFPRIPGIAGSPAVLHSSDFVHCMAYEGKRVLVIGGGNSAAEIAIDLAGAARVTMCTRGPLRFFSDTGRLEDIRGSSESLLKELVRFGIVVLREGDPATSVSGPRVTFRSGDREAFDWILCATGYRPGWIAVEGGEVRANPDGYPVMRATGESTVPGLYFCGSLARFNPRCAFIHGFRNYVEKVFWDIADRV